MKKSVSMQTKQKSWLLMTTPPYSSIKQHRQSMFQLAVLLTTARWSCINAVNSLMLGITLQYYKCLVSTWRNKWKETYTTSQTNRIKFYFCYKMVPSWLLHLPVFPETFYIQSMNILWNNSVKMSLKGYNVKQWICGNHSQRLELILLLLHKRNLDTDYNTTPLL